MLESTACCIFATIVHVIALFRALVAVTWCLELVTSRECDAVELFIHKDIKHQREHSAG